MNSTNQPKRHFVLRTHDGMPTPPGHAYGFRPVMRGGKVMSARLIAAMSCYDWSLCGHRFEIIAVEWLS